MRQIILVPPPRKVLPGSGACALPEALKAELAGYTVGAENPKGVQARVAPDLVEGEQSYRLTVSPGGPEVVAGDEKGLFYGFMTLRQLARQADESGSVPCLRIEDRPEFPVRGVLLDISRDRVPTMETLKGLIDLWAELKLNQVQLYTEHTFAYPSHRVVWRDASPLTPEEAEELDRYCRDRAIDLVPNQNSFGHLERWLEHPEYRRLAESSGGFTDPWGVFHRQPSTLNPIDPASIEFLAGLYDELLPHFASGMLNVGGDEPWELGQGASAAACRSLGVGRVYLDFLLKIHEQVSGRGRIMQFWGDIILNHTELIRELPREVIGLDWGYERDHPFARECRAFAEAGLSFYVCPGTSSWNSLGGRWENARQNIHCAADEGRAAGASGLLLTDWGDNGHWQQLPISYPAYLYAAAMGWNPEGAEALDVEAGLSRHLFRDPTGKAARALMILEKVYDDGRARIHNAGVLAVLLLPDLQVYGREQASRYRGYEFERERSQILEALRLLDGADLQAGDAGLLAAELRFTGELMLHAARLGRERFATPGLDTEEIPVAVRRELAAELEVLIERFRSLWLARSRPGGLADSAGRLTALKHSYLQG